MRCQHTMRGTLVALTFEREEWEGGGGVRVPTLTELQQVSRLVVTR